MYSVRAHGRHREIPYKDTYILLIPGRTIYEEDEEVIEHLRMYNVPEDGRGIEIIKLPDEKEKKKSVRSMSLTELRDHATSEGVDWEETDARNDIMRKLRDN